MWLGREEYIDQETVALIKYYPHHNEVQKLKVSKISWQTDAQDASHHQHPSGCCDSSPCSCPC